MDGSKQEYDLRVHGGLCEWMIFLFQKIIIVLLVFIKIEEASE